MADNIARTMQFEYKMNSNLVLTADRSLIDKRSKDEPTGEVLPIPEIDPKLMGIRGKRAPGEAPSHPSKKKKESMDKYFEEIKVGSVLNSNFDTAYMPRTNETKAVHEAMMDIIALVLPDADLYNIIGPTTNEVLLDLKNEDYNEAERKASVKSILGPQLTDARYADLLNLSNKLVDFKVAVTEESSDVNFQFGDEDNEDDDDYEDEVQDTDSDDDGVEATTDNVLVASTFDGAITQIPGTTTVLPGSTSLIHHKSDHIFETLNPKDVDAFWLQRSLSRYFNDPSDCQKRTNQCLEVLKEARNNQELENKLLRILGMDRFDLIRQLRDNRYTVYYCTLLNSAESDVDRHQIEHDMKKDSKLNRILAELKTNESRGDAISNERQKKAQARSARIQADIDMEENTPVYGNVNVLDLNNLTFPKGSHQMSNKECPLPDGSYRRTYRKECTTVFVPAPKPRPLDADEILVKVVDLPSYCKSAFEKRKTLNRIQSKVCKTALETDENLLICAPTGAGKTDVALLCMMREIGKHINNDGTIRKDDFKIIYIAPMKSLVSEMTASFSDRLKSYNLKVSMLSGDSHLSRQEITETQVIVCTPEKWDIISRKCDERAYTQLVKLLIIDEIHLLHDERGPVLEAIVARAVRSMESAHSGIEMRIVGLSATLPNTGDVAKFIRVDKKKGLFKFDSSYRPVPMEQEFIGISERKASKRIELMNEIVYEQVIKYAGKHQVLIFVHSRRETASTAKAIKDKCLTEDKLGAFLKDKKASTLVLQQDLDKVKNHDLKDLLPYGFAIHHAGLAYTDRNFVEELFTDKHIQVLVSTSTLAWGVNLPAHVVIIKGTQVYKPEKGEWTELNPLDVMQMFGRAGRPQYDVKGVGVMITNESEMDFYLSLLNEQLPIESQFITKLADNLNAEIVMGTVKDMAEAVHWMSYLYLYIRMKKNPTLYGADAAFAEDPTLENQRKNLIYTAAKILEEANMIRFDKRSGEFQSTEVGRIAAHYYCSYDTMNTFKSFLKTTTSDVDIFKVFSKCAEFKNISVRQEEKQEIKKLMENVPIPIKQGDEDAASKINCLLQAYISQLKLDRFTLSSDTVFVAQSAARLMRSMFEYALSKKWARLTNFILETCKEIEQRMWSCSCPLRQFKKITPDIIKKLEKKPISFASLVEMKHHELGELVTNHKMGKTIFKYIHQIPKLEMKTHLQPITRSTMKVELTITPDFDWCPKTHGTSLGFWVFVEDVMKENIIHHEYFLLKEKLKNEDHILKFYVTITDPLPPLYFIRAVSDRWIGSETEITMNFFEVLLPEKTQPCTELLDLQRLPIGALRNEEFEAMYEHKMSFFNAIQTQCFESLYNSDESVFIGAPTGSGKTVCAEFAMLRLFSTTPDARCVYVSAQEDVAQIRYNEWSKSFGALKKNVIKLTGNITLDQKNISKANIIIATAERWDIQSRRWKARKAIQNIKLFIADDLHLIGSHYNGSTLEIVCSRTRYMCSQLESPIRIIGLSYSLTNARNVGDWLDCSSASTYNFHPSVRHRPLNIDIVTFNTTHNATRIASMHKPVYQAIIKQPPNCPVIIFVPTMNQAEEVAYKLTKFALADKKNFSRASEAVVTEYLRNITNETLIESLSGGVGFIHEALTADERNLVKKLFTHQMIQILVVSQSLCWTIPPEAHLVIVMDTQYYNGKDCMYNDYSAVDLIQMVGRANCSLYDDAKAIVMCQANKRDFVQKFLLDPLPLESHLDQHLHDHFNAEIVTKTIETKQDSIDYLTWTFFYYRITKNPNYYNLAGVSHRLLSDHLSVLVENVFADLENSKCISIRNDCDLSPINLGMIAAYYYIHYTTIEMFSLSLKPNSKVRMLLELICNADEFESLPIRHGEDILLDDIRQLLRLPLPVGEDRRLTDPRVKANVLLLAHLARVPIESAELREDLNKVLEKAVSLIQAVVDVLSSNRWLGPALASMELAQMITQAQWHRDSLLKQIPHFNDPRIMEKCEELNLKTVFEVIELDEENKFYAEMLDHGKLQDVVRFLHCYPNIDLTYEVKKTVKMGDSVTVSVSLAREEDAGTVFAPFYPAAKEENWWLVVGDPNQGNLISIKLLAGKDTAELKFEAPKRPGQYEYALYFMCDSYLGCDQEYKFTVDVV